MQDPLYKVVFSGEITGEFDPDTSRKQFAKLFRLSRAKANALFSGKEFVIKNNVSEEMAMRFAVAVAEAGCESTVEPVSDGYEPLGFPDRRKCVRRLLIRASGGMDRRKQPGRRRVDIRMSGVNRY